MVDKQMDMLQTAMAKSPRALGIAAPDSRAVIPILQEAQRNKIPVIAFDSGEELSSPQSTPLPNRFSMSARTSGFSLPQPLKASLPMVVTLSGIVTEVRLAHP
jgi:hypothetical protein